MSTRSLDVQSSYGVGEGEIVEIKDGIERRPEVQLLREMLEIGSLSGQERGLAEYLCGQAKVLGLTSCIDEVGNFVACTKGDPLQTSPSVKDIMLVGHMDVVPGEVAIRHEGDLLYGRGAVDAKGPLAGFLLATSRVKFMSSRMMSYVSFCSNSGMRSGRFSVWTRRACFFNNRRAACKTSASSSTINRLPKSLIIGN